MQMQFIIAWPQKNIVLKVSTPQVTVNVRVQRSKDSLSRTDEYIAIGEEAICAPSAPITTALYYILQGGGFTTGGNNFDAKLRRQSIDPADLFYAHIGGVDTVARGFLNAAAMIERREFADIAKERYAGWRGELGSAILNGKTTLESLTDGALQEGIAPKPRSGRQELIENKLGSYL